jgi:SHS2 domain-containing protein
MYETFEHTADLGLRVRAPDFDGLLQEAARALFVTIAEDLSTIRLLEQIEIRISGEQPDYLLFDWLNELLFRFESTRMIFGHFEVHASNGSVGSAWGEKYDPDRHRLAHEVKAITYHGLVVQRNADGWLAEFIVDI